MNRPLEEILAEQNAVSSIDLVYFLLIPITLFIMSQIHQIITTPITSIFSLLFFPGGLVSLPFALYAKMVDSICYRIRAWGVYILLSSVWFGEALLLFVTELIFPQFSLTTTFNQFFQVLSLAQFLRFLTFNLGVFTFGIAIASAWMRWVFNVFLKRVPSRRDEIERSLHVFVLKSWIVPRLKFSHRSDALLLIVGLGIYLTFLIITMIGLSF